VFLIQISFVFVLLKMYLRVFHGKEIPSSPNLTTHCTPSYEHATNT